MKILNDQFPKEIMGMTVGSLAFKNTEGSWDFVFDTKYEGGIYNMRFHLVFLHQVKDTVRLLDFTVPYWRSIAEEANKIDMGDAPLIDVDSVNPNNQSYVYHTEISQYGAVFEQDREQNKVFHEELLPALYADLTRYIEPMRARLERIVSGRQR